MLKITEGAWKGSIMNVDQNGVVEAGYYKYQLVGSDLYDGRDYNPNEYAFETEEGWMVGVVDWL